MKTMWSCRSTQFFPPVPDVQVGLILSCNRRSGAILLRCVQMNEATGVTAPSASAHAAAAFWERLWRSAGVQCAGLFVVAYVAYGYQPPVGAPANEVVAFYDGHRV